MDNKLNIELQKDSIVIKIDSLGNDLKKIKNYILKNFKEYSMDIDTITLVPNLLATKEEMLKRLKLIKWVIQESKLLNKDPNLAKKILKSYEQKIKIYIEFYKVNQDIISIRLSRYKDNILVLKVQNEFLSIISNIILNFLKRQCNPIDIIKFNKETREILLNTQSDTFAKSLSAIIRRESIVGKGVVFFYDKEYINSLLKDYRRDSKKINSAREYILKLRKAFEILQVDKSEKDLTIIKMKYLKLVKTYHPDRHYKKSNTHEYEQKFLQIKEAYEVIKEHLERRSA